jgi:hypothetical protein
MVKEQIIVIDGAQHHLVWVSIPGGWSLMRMERL